MRTRQDRALQIYTNCLDLGCGFAWAADNVLVLAPTPGGATWGLKCGWTT